MDIRTLHSNCMNKLRGLLNKKARITYADKTSYIVPCTISDETIDAIKYTEYVGKDYKVFNVLIKDLKEVGAPMNQFMFIEIDRVKYQVQTHMVNGIFNNTISLVALIYKK